MRGVRFGVQAVEFRGQGGRRGRGAPSDLLGLRVRRPVATPPRVRRYGAPTRLASGRCSRWSGVNRDRKAPCLTPHLVVRGQPALQPKSNHASWNGRPHWRCLGHDPRQTPLDRGGLDCLRCSHTPLEDLPVCVCRGHRTLVARGVRCAPRRCSPPWLPTPSIFRLHARDRSPKTESPRCAHGRA